MKNRKLCRLFAAVLAVAMVAAMIPVSALAGFTDWFSGWKGTVAEEETVETLAMTSETEDYRIVMLDCGRKYFSVDNVKKLIDTLAQYGYNQLTLAFGNGGCRFLLDDMSLSFGNVTMASATVKNNITAGNDSFNGDTRYLSQSDMDTIIAYANAKNIEIVPLLNMPGHATAIVHNTSYTSNGNLNVNDETSREYGYALLKKYVDYFKGKGCKYFHFGADESGFSGSGMSTFLQGCADVITNAGMTPRMFNDPADGTNTIPTGVEITYWYQNNHQSASALNSNGYSLINTHGRWYYVIKAAQNSESGTKYWQGTVNSTETSVELPVLKAEKMDQKWVGINEFFDGNPGYGSTISGSKGTMFCIWCDASQDTYLTDSDVISENENYGALYQLEKLAEHYWPEDIKDTAEGTEDTTVTDDTKGISVTGPGLTGITVRDNSIFSDSNSVSGAERVKAYDITLNDGAYTEAATVTFPRPDGWTDNSRIRGFVVNGTTNQVEKPLITPNSVTETAVTVEIPHFSVVGLAYLSEEAVSATNTENVNLEVGKTYTAVTTAVAAEYITTNDKYIATAVVAEGEATAAGVQQVTSITSGKKYIIGTYSGNYVVTNTTSASNGWNANGLNISNVTINTANLSQLLPYAWTITGENGSYTVMDANGKYMKIGTSNNNVTLSGDAQTLTIEKSSNKFAFVNGNVDLNNFGGGNTLASSYAIEYTDGSHTNDLWTLYEIVEESTGGSTLTITGIGEGNTSATVGDTTYNITVTAPSVTENQTLSYSGSFTPAGTDITITSGADVVSLADGKIVAGKTAGTATVTSVEKNTGGYVTKHHAYNVTVSAIDFSKIADLNVQLWITNTWVGENEAPSSLQTVDISAKDAYSEEGFPLKNFVPETGYKKDGANTVRVTYWKGSVVDTAPVQQGADLSGSGKDFTMIRYWNNAWQYLNEDGEWTAVNNGQYVIAYYLQINNVSPEITTGTKDYGNPPTSHPGTNSGNGYTMTAFAVVYPDGSLSRTERQMYDTGMMRGFWGSTEFGIGVVFAENNSTYKVSKMTLTWGTNIKGTSGDNWYTGNQSGTFGTDWGVKWDKVTNSAGVEWYDETIYWQYGDSEIPTIDGDKYGLKFNTTNHHAALILIYLETVETDDSLNVIYWDDSSNIQIPTNDIFIDVKNGTTFYTGLKQTATVPSADDVTFTLNSDAYIENSDGVQQGFNTEISTVPGVSGAYLSGLYKFENASFDNDGKTLVLHFTLEAGKQELTYVVDFGLPLEISVGDFFEADPNITAISLVKGGSSMKETGHYGTATISNAGSEYKVSYSMFKPLPVKVTIPLYITFRGETEAELYQAHVIPASNVLYEENFLTVGDGWEQAGTALNATQSNQLAKADGIYGYDAAYATSTNVSGGYYEATNLNTSTMTAALTTTFTGTGFDLIGNCGPDTGRVMVILQNQATQKRYVSIVDTRYGTTENDALYQVPLVHREVPEGTYVAQIFASAAEAITADNTSAVSTYSVKRASAPVDAFERYLKQNHITDVEYFTMSNDLAASVQSVSAVSTYATTAAVVSRPLGNHVEIDAFRVYYSTNNDNYNTAEKDVQYENILEAVEGEIIAWTETNGEYTGDVTNYEANGGPEKEIYLNPNQPVAVTFDVEGVNQIQVSLRSVDGKSVTVTTANDGNAITSSTEMYYTLEKSGGAFTIVNTGEGVLGIGNIKVPGDAGEAAILTASELEPEVVSYSLRMALAVEPDQPEEPEQPEVFLPQSFNASCRSVNVLRNKLVTVSVTASTDVAYITVNGQKVNAWNNALGWIYQPDTLRFTFTDLIKRGESKTYEIVAYNADGVASAVYTVQG